MEIEGKTFHLGRVPNDDDLLEELVFKKDDIISLRDRISNASEILGCFYDRECLLDEDCFQERFKESLAANDSFPS